MSAESLARAALEKLERLQKLVKEAERQGLEDLCAAAFYVKETPIHPYWLLGMVGCAALDPSYPSELVSKLVASAVEGMRRACRTECEFSLGLGGCKHCAVVSRKKRFFKEKYVVERIRDVKHVAEPGKPLSTQVQRWRKWCGNLWEAMMYALPVLSSIESVMIARDILGVEPPDPWKAACTRRRHAKLAYVGSPGPIDRTVHIVYGCLYYNFGHWYHVFYAYPADKIYVGISQGFDDGIVEWDRSCVVLECASTFFPEVLENLALNVNKLLAKPPASLVKLSWRGKRWLVSELTIPQDMVRKIRQHIEGAARGETIVSKRVENIAREIWKLKHVLKIE